MLPFGFIRAFMISSRVSTSYAEHACTTVAMLGKRQKLENDLLPAAASPKVPPRKRSKFNVWKSGWKDLLSEDQEKEADERNVVRNTKIICTL
eukprot:g16083.t1